MTKTVTYHTLDAIAGHGIFRCFSRDSQTEAGKSQRIGSGKNRKIRIPGFYRTCEDVAEISPSAQPSAPLKARITHNGSGRKPGSPLSAAGFNNPAPPLAGHARTKAVGAFTMDNARLKRSLHRCPLLKLVKIIGLGCLKPGEFTAWHPPLSSRRERRSKIASH